MAYRPKVASTTSSGSYRFNSSTITVANGVASLTAAPAKKSWSLLNTLTVSTSTATMMFTNSSYANYSELYLQWENLIPTTAAASVQLDFSSDGYTSVLYAGYQNNRYCGYSQGIFLGGGGTSTTPRQGFIHLINNSTDATKNVIGGFGDYQASSGNGLHYGSLTAVVFSTTAINGVRLLFSGSNVASGVARLYGVL